MRFSLLISAIAISLTANADLTLNVRPGELHDHPAIIGNVSGTLTIRGKINAADFEVLGNLPANITKLDLGAAAIMAYYGDNSVKEFADFSPAGRIPDYAFFQSATREIVLPRESRIGEGCFARSHTETVTLGLSTKEIPAYAFYKSGLKTLINTAIVERIGEEAFAGCDAETLAFHGLQATGDYAFAECRNLKTITLSSGASHGIGILMGCPKLEHVYGKTAILPDYFAANSGITQDNLAVYASSVGRYALANTLASTLWIGADVEKLEEGSCLGMTELKSVNVNDRGANPPDVDQFAFEGIDTRKVQLIVVPGSYDVWKTHDAWGNFDIQERLLGVDAVTSSAESIRIKIEKNKIEIISETNLQTVEVYDTSGALLYSAAPANVYHEINVDLLRGARVVLVKASDGHSANSVKVIL